MPLNAEYLKFKIIINKKILFNKSKKRLKINQIKANLSYYHAYDFKNF